MAKRNVVPGCFVPNHHEKNGKWNKICRKVNKRREVIAEIKKTKGIDAAIEWICKNPEF